MSYSTTDVLTKFTYQWRIENCANGAFYVYKDLQSAKFTAPTLGDFEWYLKVVFFRGKMVREERLYVSLWRNDFDPTIEANYSLSIGGIGWPKSLESDYGRGLQTFGRISSEEDGIFSRSEVSINWDEYIKNVNLDVITDVLLIECCLWPSNPRLLPPSPYTVSLSSRTLFPVESRSFFLPLRNYANIPERCLVGNMVVASGGESPLQFTCELYKGNHGEIIHDFCLWLKQNSQLSTTFVVKTQIYVIDASTKYYSLCTLYTVYRKNCSNDPYPRFFRLKYFKRKDLYLRDGVLLLFFKFTITAEKPFHFVQSRLYNTSYLLVTSDILTVKQTSHDCLDQKYKKHPLDFRLLAILIVILSILGLLFKYSIFGTDAL